MKERIDLTIKPTMGCNLRCKHCFNGHSLEERQVCDSDTAIEFIAKAALEFRKIKLTFHGGEPSLAGTKYYERIFGYIRQLRDNGYKLSIFFTTNGLLLKGRLLELLLENDVFINISFDGLDNSLLRDHSDKVYSNLCSLRQSEARFRIFCTVCNPSYLNLRKNYEWFKTNGFDYRIFPIDPFGFAKENSKFLMNIDDFLDQLGATYHYWLQDLDCNIKVDTFLKFAALRRDCQFKPYWFNEELALNPDGVIYPFGRPNDRKYPLGTPGSISKITDCFNCDNYQIMRGRIKDLWDGACGNCPSNGVCNGVCLAMKYMYTSDDGELKSACRMANGIFMTTLGINEKIRSTLSPEEVNPTARDILFK